jgi:hypothetical protein
LVLAVELVPVVEALRTEELLGGHPVPVKLHQQGEPLLCPAQLYFLPNVFLSVPVICPSWSISLLNLFSRQLNF